ncbi:abhydrolase domain-containing protein [Microsporum canis CBS 113480]|uniref:Abhydrolase domain-containing protein n=1 Tax=Arthroderma otae (strain ATCC MYA-4605 / CBS 113480) TaxID=554155 RepID=C5FRR3_ARTOC|nr:abhydrolase domain-containing protein [Microsporum canis CBS 113480]EEQ32566.1 abhydrolase domain-containing protein [Microsporum canis CBS 113480]
MPTMYRLRPSSFVRRYSAAPRVPLAYSLYKPRGQRQVANRPPVVFMHGLFGCRKNNRSMSKVLAFDLETSVYAVDLRNHGDSPHHPKHDYTELALDVERFILEHSLRDPILIGHSMGAKTALTLALRSPSLVSGVIAIDNGPIRLPLTDDFPRYIRGMRHVQSQPSPITSLSQADSLLAQYEPDPAIRLFLLTNLAKTPGHSHLRFRVPLDILASSLGALGDFPYTNPQETRFEKPALIVRATRSHYLPDESKQLMHEFFPNLRIVDFDCGHWVITEKPHEFRQIAVKFLRDTVLSTS